MGLAGVLQVRSGEADDGAHRDEAGPVGGVAGPYQGGVHGLDVLAVLQPLHVPAVGGVAPQHVLAEGGLGVALDGDVVVVVEHDQVAQALVAGQAAGLGADALLEVAVGAEHPDHVVEDRLARGGIGVEQTALAPGRHRHADRVAHALAQRAGGDLDARGVAVLRVAGGQRPPLPQVGQVLHGQAVARQEQLHVQGQAAVPAGQHEAVPAGPGRLARVVAQQPAVEQVGRGRQAHRGPRVAGAGRLDGVHGQRAGHVDGGAVQVGPVQGGPVQVGVCAQGGTFLRTGSCSWAVPGDRLRP